MARARRLISVTISRDPDRASLDEDAAASTSAVSASPAEPLLARLRVLFDLEEPLRECDQRAGEVAAVDSRDVARVQRRQARGVVPVEKVSRIALETCRLPSVASRRRSSASVDR
jgi:hypothetical protein